MKLIFLTGHRKGGTSVFHKLFDGHPETNSFPVDISIFYAYFPYFTSEYSDDRDFLISRLKLVLSKTMRDLDGKVVFPGTRLFRFETYWQRIIKSINKAYPFPSGEHDMLCGLHRRRWCGAQL